VRLLLARHGQTVWNAGRRFQGGSDVGLSDLGRAQAEALGRAVRGYRVAAAYVSPLKRALETAEIALAGTGIPLVPLPELRELSLGEWEGFTVGEIRARDGDPYLAWLRAPHDCPPPGGEPLPDVCARMLRAVEPIGARHPHGDDVLVIAGLGEDQRPLQHGDEMFGNAVRIEGRARRIPALGGGHLLAELLRPGVEGAGARLPDHRLDIGKLLRERAEQTTAEWGGLAQLDHAIDVPVDPFQRI